jgi:hypothetical protein
LTVSPEHLGHQPVNEQVNSQGEENVNHRICIFFPFVRDGRDGVEKKFQAEDEEKKNEGCPQNRGKNVIRGPAVWSSFFS